MSDIPEIDVAGQTVDTEADVDLELAARLRVALARLARQLRQQAGPQLSPTLQSVLATIALYGPLPLGELASREQVAPPTITKLLARLDEQGLIERQRGADDKRVTLVSLTADGQRQFDESRTRRTAWLVDRLAHLDDAQQTDLARAVELLEAIANPEGTVAPAVQPPSGPDAAAASPHTDPAPTRSPLPRAPEPTRRPAP
ncbi:MAG: MarR family transcriptional regulator [Acidimicrobiales bacterium]